MLVAKSHVKFSTLLADTWDNCKVFICILLIITLFILLRGTPRASQKIMLPLFLAGMNKFKSKKIIVHPDISKQMNLAVSSNFFISNILYRYDRPIHSSTISNASRYSDKTVASISRLNFTQNLRARFHKHGLHLHYRRKVRFANVLFRYVKIFNIFHIGNSFLDKK